MHNDNQYGWVYYTIVHYIYIIYVYANIIIIQAFSLNITNHSWLDDSMSDVILSFLKISFISLKLAFKNTYDKQQIVVVSMYITSPYSDYGYK